MQNIPQLRFVNPLLQRTVKIFVRWKVSKAETLALL